MTTAATTAPRYAEIPTDTEWAPSNTLTFHGPARNLTALFDHLHTLTDVEVYSVVSALAVNNPEVLENMLSKIA